MTSSQDSFVSVIIPVYNDAERLGLCLRALSVQTYPQDHYEVIVIDNDSAESIAPVVAAFAHVRVAFEGYRGPAAARNRGIAEARGDIIAFTDSDCIPAPDWIQQGVTYLHSVPNCGLVAGKVEIFAADPQHPNAVELYEQLTAYDQKRYLQESRFGATANVFTFKSVIEDVGTLNPKMEIYREDVEWGQRVFAAGYAQVYGETAVVAHPARRTLSDLSKKLARTVGGQVLRRKNTAYPFGAFLYDVFREAVPNFRHIGAAMRDKRLVSTSQRLKILVMILIVRYLRVYYRIRLWMQRDVTRKAVDYGTV
jgi:glycosyltransferase involved in cell wall biosynthesis